MTAGRPIKFKSVEELEKKIEAYFESCFENQWFDEYDRDDMGNRLLDDSGKFKKIPVLKKVQIKPVSISGLAVALNTSRRTLLDYEDGEQTSIDEDLKIEFSHTIKKAKQFIENCLEDGMLRGDINPTAGIFNAKNNFGWVDKKEFDHTSKGKQVGGFNYLSPQDEADNNSDNKTDD